MKRVLVAIDAGPRSGIEYLTYEVDEAVAIGQRVSCPYGNWQPTTKLGTVVAEYPPGSNYQLRMERCECGRPGVRLDGGQFIAGYFGDCKQAHPLEVVSR